MLSYRHGFHAGNHADVFKHLVLIECLDRLVKKDKPLLYIDTHAGAGSYRLHEGYAAMNKEWATGIARLTASSQAGPVPAAITRYLSVVSRYAEPGTAYPGSPMIAATLLRAQDRLALFELHPTTAIRCPASCRRPTGRGAHDRRIRRTPSLAATALQASAGVDRSFV